MRADSSGGKPVESSNWKRMDRARAPPWLKALKLDNVPVPCRVTVNSGEFEEADVEVDERFVEAGYCASVIVSAVCFVREVAKE